MRVGLTDRAGLGRFETSGRFEAGHVAEWTTLYTVEQFVFLIEREQARADRAAAKAPPANQASALPVVAAAPLIAPKPSGGQPKPSSIGVWGATTGNREFSLVIFRPQTRADRAGLVELLQRNVRTTDAVGIVDARRLGVLLPDTAAENAVHFVKKVLAQAAEDGVSLSHIVHTYPNVWPEDNSADWDEPRRNGAGSDEVDPRAANAAVASLAPQTHTSAARTKETGLVHSLFGLLQLVPAALRRSPRRAVRATA